MYHAEEIYKLVRFTKVSPMGSHKIEGLSDCLHLANQITELERKYTYLMEVRHVFDMYPIKQSKMYAGITDIMKTIADERTKLYEESRKIYKKNKIDLVVDIMPQLMAIDEKIAQISSEIGRARNTEYHIGKLEDDPRIQDLYAKIASLEAERNALASKLPNIKLYNRVEVPKEKTANLEKRPVQEIRPAQFSLSGMSYKREWADEYQKLAAEYSRAIYLDSSYKQMPFSQFIRLYKVENPVFKELADVEAKRAWQLMILINSEYPKYCAAMGDKTPLSLEEFLMQNYQVNANDITNRYYIEQYYETQKEKNSGFGSR